MRPLARTVILLLSCVPWMIAAPARAERDPHPVDAIAAILAAFDQHPIVALGMSHRQQDEADFAVRLVRDSRFAARVQVVVVEAGNALYQRDLDRYVDGRDVPRERLQLVWRNTTQPGSADVRGTWELLAAIREVNRGRKPNHRIRVLAGDPPIDWDRIRKPEDYAPFMSQRDSHFASVVDHLVLAKRQKALLVIGAAHVMRHAITWASEPGVETPNVTMLLERSHPGSTFVVIPHDDFGRHNAELEPRLSAWPVPSIADLQDTWIGELPAGEVFGAKIRRVGSDPAHAETPYPGLQLEDLADAYLYLGPIASIKEVELQRESGTPYARELDRRRNLIGGGAVPVPLPAAGH